MIGPCTQRIDCFRTIAVALALVVVLGASFAPLARGGEADVIGVEIRRTAERVYDFDVTVRSQDRGWSYYADAFEVLAPDGSLLGRRVLLHPHEHEQPFTRDLYGVRIPAGIDRVTVRARHKPRGYDGASMTVELPRR